MNLILKEVADEMGLQAVPFVVNGGDRRCILYIPEMMSVGSEEYTDALSVLNSLKSKGASFQNFVRQEKVDKANGNIRVIFTPWKLSFFRV